MALGGNSLLSGGEIRDDVEVTAVQLRDEEELRAIGRQRFVGAEEFG